MADSVTAQDKGSGFVAHDEGQFAAVCVDVVDLGERVEQYPGKPARIVAKCALVFVTDTVGETKEIAREVTVSMGEKANLRAFLEAWRGKSYTPEQATAGVPLHKLVGHAALISVEHKRSAKGRTYGLIKTIAPLPKSMAAPSENGYARADFWAERKKGYAEEAKQWAAKMLATSDEPPLPPEDEGDPDDDLPF